MSFSQSTCPEEVVVAIACKDYSYVVFLHVWNNSVNFGAWSDRVSFAIAILYEKGINLKPC